MAKTSRGAQIRAGIVVIAGLLILVIGLFLVSGGFESLREKTRYTVLFPNAGGLVPGDAVFLEGRRVGKVVDVDTRDVTRDGETRTYVAVTIEIRRVDRIHLDSEFKVTKTLTGIVTMNINYGTSGKEADESSELFGKRLATFDETVDEVHDLVAEARKVVGDIDHVVLSIDETLRDLKLPEIRDRLVTFADALTRAAEGAEKLVGDAQEPVQRTLGHVEGAAGRAETLLDRIERDWGGLQGKLDATLDDVQQAAADLRGITGDARPKVKSIMQGLDDAVKRAEPALAKIEALGQELQQTVIEVRPDLAATLQNARTAFANFQAVTEDLKTAPWKLINKPSDKEVAEVHLYNAARLYVANAGKVREQIEDLDTLRRLGVLADPAQAEVVTKVIERLQLSLADFDKREKELVELIVAAKN